MLTQDFILRLVNFLFLNYWGNKNPKLLEQKTVKYVHLIPVNLKVLYK